MFSSSMAQHARCFESEVGLQVRDVIGADVPDRLLVQSGLPRQGGEGLVEDVLTQIAEQAARDQALVINRWQRLKERLVTMLAPEPAPPDRQARRHPAHWRIAERLRLRAVAVQAAKQRPTGRAGAHRPRALGLNDASPVAFLHSQGV